MKRVLRYFSISLTIIVFLAIAQVIVANRIATTGFALAKLEKDVDSYKKHNAILREEVLSLSSLNYIASEAARLGFIEAESELVLTSKPPLARRP